MIKKPAKKLAGNAVGKKFRAQWKILVDQYGSNAELHRMCGGDKVVSIQTVGDWANGVSLPRLEQLALVAEKLGVTLDWLVRGVGPETPGATRATATLANDITRHVWAAVIREMPVVANMFEDADTERFGRILLAYCENAALEEWRANLAVAERQLEAKNQRVILEEIARAAGNAKNTNGVTMGMALKGSIRVLRQIEDEAWPDGPLADYYRAMPEHP